MEPLLFFTIGAGLFPAEMVFTERAIPVLVEAGIEWVIVANNHISRACKVNNYSSKYLFYNLMLKGYPYSPHGDNNSPPNPADQVKLIIPKLHLICLSCNS